MTRGLAGEGAAWLEGHLLELGDALFGRRMGAEELRDVAAAERVDDVEVLHGRVTVRQRAAHVTHLELFERTGQRQRIAEDLGTAGVGRELARAGDGELD